MTVTRPSCLLPRVLESCTVGPVSSGDAILSAGSSWLRPQYSRCTGLWLHPLLLGEEGSVSRGHNGDTAAGVCPPALQSPLPRPLQPPQGRLRTRLQRERHCLGVTVPLPAPGPVPVQLPPRCRCRGVGGPSVGHPGLSSHGAVSWQRGDQQDCPMPSRCGHFLCLLHLSQLVLLTAVWGEVMMYLFICIPRCQ